VDDKRLMEKAVKQAYKALERNEIPIGALLVDSEGNILAQGYNQVEKKQSQLAHAEMIVLHKATKKINNWRLMGATLYVTLQPCMMCLGALYLSRVSRIVYGVDSPKFGISCDKAVISGIYKNLSLSIECMEYKEAGDILRNFFQKKRSMKRV